MGFGGSLAEGPDSDSYGNVPSFDGRGGGFSATRYHFPNGWFVGDEGGGVGLGMNGISRVGAFGNMLSLNYEGVQFGYNFKNAPLTIHAGFDTLKYNAGIGGAFSPFDNVSGTLPGYSAHAGFEYHPTPNVSLSLDFGYTQQSGRIDSDINSLTLPGASPFAFNGRR
jgi:hypothetical protein